MISGFHNREGFQSCTCNTNILLGTPGSLRSHWGTPLRSSLFPRCGLQPPHDFRQDNATNVSSLAQGRCPRGLRCLEVRCWRQFGVSTSCWRDEARLGGTYNILGAQLTVRSRGDTWRVSQQSLRAVCLAALETITDGRIRSSVFRTSIPRIHSHSP